MKNLKSDFRYLLISGLVCLFLIGIVFAAHQVTTANGVSYVADEDTIQLYNFSINNTDTGLALNITQVNITLPSGFVYSSNSLGTNVSSNYSSKTSDTLISFTNLTGLIFNETNRVYFWFNATATNPGRYNITIITTNVSGSTKNNNISVTINDTTVPNVTVSYPSSSEKQNYSRTSGMIFNLSVTDNNRTHGCWYSFNGTAINYTMSNTTELLYNATNATLKDGAYRVSFYCNDSWGNVNNTGNTSFVLDSAEPTITHSCSPTSVIDGEVVTCTCSASDSTSGLNGSVVYTTNPATNIVGTFTTTCTSKDHANNNATSSITYSVSGSSGGGGSGGGGAISYTNTFVEDNKELSEIGEINQELGAKSRIRVKINNEKHYVGVIELSTTTANIEISSTPQTATLLVGDERRFDVDEDGKYYDLYVKLNSIKANKADITIKSINVEITKETLAEEEEKEAETTVAAENLNNKSPMIWWIIGIIVILVIAGIGYGIKKRK